MPQLDLLIETDALQGAGAKQQPYSPSDSLSNRLGLKSPEALRTISEVAAALGEETHVLRFWETKFPNLQPIKMKGGRRYYRPEDVALLWRIRTLLHEQGYTIKGAQAVLASGAGPAAGESGPDAEKSRERLKNALAELREIRTILHSFHRA